MEPLVIAALNYVNSRRGPRKTEVERLRELERVAAAYKRDHQGFSEDSANLSTSSCSIRSASAFQ